MNDENRDNISKKCHKYNTHTKSCIFVHDNVTCRTGYTNVVALFHKHCQVVKINGEHLVKKLVSLLFEAINTIRKALCTAVCRSYTLWQIFWAVICGFNSCRDSIRTLWECLCTLVKSAHCVIESVCSLRKVFHTVFKGLRAVIELVDTIWNIVTLLQDVLDSFKIILVCDFFIIKVKILDHFFKLVICCLAVKSVSIAKVFGFLIAVILEIVVLIVAYEKKSEALAWHSRIREILKRCVIVRYSSYSNYLKLNSACCKLIAHWQRMFLAVALFDYRFALFLSKTSAVKLDKVNVISFAENTELWAVLRGNVNAEMLFKSNSFVCYFLFLLVCKRNKNAELSVLNLVLLTMFGSSVDDSVCACNHGNYYVHSHYDKQYKRKITCEICFKLTSEPFSEYPVHYKSSNSAAGMRVSLR